MRAAPRTRPNRVCRPGPRIRGGQVVLAALMAVVPTIAGGCSSKGNSSIQVAPATGTGDRVEPVGFDRYEISPAMVETAIPTEPPTTTTIAEMVPLSSAPTVQSAPTAGAAPATDPTPAPTVSRVPVPTVAPGVVADLTPSPGSTPAKAKRNAKPTGSPAPTLRPSVAPPAATTSVGAVPPTPQPTSPPISPPTSPLTSQPTSEPNAAVSTAPDLLRAKAPGFDGKTLKIGILSTTVHPIWGTIGKALKAGLEARVATINRRGGIGGRYRIELVFAETNYDPGQTATQLNATKDLVAGYAQILGTPNVEAVEPILKQFQLVASPASQEARWATSPNLLPIGNNYQVQAINGISYFLEQSALTNSGTRPRVCAASVATSYGEAGNEGFRFAQERLGFDAGPVVSVGATETSMATYSAQLRNAGCAAVMVTVGPAQTLGLVVSGRQQGFSPRWIIMGASFSERIIVPLTGPLFEQGAWVVGDGTQWGDASVIGMPTVRNELIAADHRFWTENPDVGLTYGYVQGRVIEAVLEKAVALGDLSHQGLLNASRQIGTVDTLGLTSPIDYSQATRLANGRTTIFAVDGSYQNAIKVLSRDYTSPTGQAYKK